MKTTNIIETTLYAAANTSAPTPVSFDSFDLPTISARAHRARAEAMRQILKSVNAHISGWMQRSRATADLNRLDDRLLRDIGVDRAEIPLPGLSGPEHGVRRLDEASADHRGAQPARRPDPARHRRELDGNPVPGQQ